MEDKCFTVEDTSSVFDVLHEKTVMKWEFTLLGKNPSDIMGKSNGQKLLLCSRLLHRKEERTMQW